MKLTLDYLLFSFYSGNDSCVFSARILVFARKRQQQLGADCQHHFVARVLCEQT